MTKRINLKFSTDNIKQNQAYSILQQHSRDKTQFISDCIDFYVNNQGINHGVNRDEIKQIVLELLNEYFNTTPMPKEIEQPVNDNLTTSENSTDTKSVLVEDSKDNLNDTIENMDNETMQDILGGLSIFDSM